MMNPSLTDDQYGRYLADVFIPDPSSPSKKMSSPNALVGSRARGSQSLGATVLGHKAKWDPANYISIDQKLIATGVFEVRGDV